MTKNPFMNALIAIAYIALISTFMFYGQGAIGPGDSVIMPMTMLSLLTLSAAFMSLTFFYRPVRMYLDGDKQGSVSLLVKTIVIFGCVTVLLIATLILIF
jgi:hypothetical protein